jgi:hypothetical protein
MAQRGDWAQSANIGEMRPSELCRVVAVKSAYQSRIWSEFVRPETGVRFGRKELPS